MVQTNKPVKICITGAAGQIAYSLIPLVCEGVMFGPNQPIILHLLDIPMCEEALKGVVMEIQDCAYKLLHGLISTVKPEEAFNDVDFIIMLGAFPRKKGMERKDLLTKNAGIFKEQGAYINKYAKKTVKVCIFNLLTNLKGPCCWKSCKY